MGNAGVMVQLPIWHWGEGVYKVKAAKAEARDSPNTNLEDAKEKIELQVDQSAFKSKRSRKETGYGAKRTLKKRMKICVMQLSDSKKV